MDEGREWVVQLPEWLEKYGEQWGRWHQQVAPMENPWHTNGGEWSVGKVVEIAFSIWSGIDDDRTLYTRSGPHHDFKFERLGRTYKLDTKGCVKHPYCMPVRHNAVHNEAPADVFVLGHWVRELHVVILKGWQLRAFVQRCNLDDVGGHGILSYTVPVHQLRPMQSLADGMGISPPPSVEL